MEASQDERSRNHDSTDRSADRGFAQEWWNRREGLRSRRRRLRDLLYASGIETARGSCHREGRRYGAAVQGGASRSDREEDQSEIVSDEAANPEVAHEESGPSFALKFDPVGTACTSDLAISYCCD